MMFITRSITITFEKQYLGGTLLLFLSSTKDFNNYSKKTNSVYSILDFCVKSVNNMRFMVKSIDRERLLYIYIYT